jgi:hypothetical protein
MRDCEGKIRNGERPAKARREIYMRDAVKASESEVKGQ